jgi:hypothetical protein
MFALPAHVFAGDCISPAAGLPTSDGIFAEDSLQGALIRRFNSPRKTCPTGLRPLRGRASWAERGRGAETDWNDEEPI